MVDYKKFDDCINIFRKFGLKGEVSVNAKSVSVKTNDKFSQEIFRKTMKASAETKKSNYQEKKRGGFWIFEIQAN